MMIHPVIDSQLRDFCSVYSDLKDDKSEAFEVMSIFSIENGVLGGKVKPEDIHLGGKEFGIDGIGILIQGELCKNSEEAEDLLSHGKDHNISFHFFQSKLSKKVEYGNLIKFLDGIYDFFTELKHLSGSQIEDLSSAKKKIFETSSKNSPSLKCYYCTTGSGEISNDISVLISRYKDKFAKLHFFRSIDIEIFGVRKIIEGYRAATNSIRATISFAKNLTMPAHDKVDEAFLGIVPAYEIIKLVRQEDENGNPTINRSIFYDNVRDYNPESDINNSIIKDIESGDCLSFVFKNNGVTVVAQKIQRKGDYIILEDYQIVNGCQTVSILASMPDKISDIMVPLKIVGSSDSDFVSKIIIGNNKQNEVKGDQFWALLPFMKDLEDYCRSRDDNYQIYIERRENQYRGTSLERTRITKPSDLMKVAAAMFFAKPHRAARDHRGIRQEFLNKIFLKEHDLRLYHLAAFALFRFDYMIRTKRIDRSRSIFKFYILYSLIEDQKGSIDKNILDMKDKDRKEIYDSVMNILKKQDDFVEYTNNVSGCLEELVDDYLTNNKNDKMTNNKWDREKIRDCIRSENFCRKFINYRYSR